LAVTIFTTVTFFYVGSTDLKIGRGTRKGKVEMQRSMEVKHGKRKRGEKCH
jgi:hypothetical protein